MEASYGASVNHFYHLFLFFPPFWCFETLATLIEIRDSPLGGLGVFAKTDIPKGTRVLAESYLLRVLGADEEDVDAKKIIFAYNALYPSQQEQYLSLHKHIADQLKMFSLYTANAFTGVILLGSRINRSCIPSLNFSHTSVLNKTTFHSIRDIPAGEELIIDYIGAILLPRSQRQSLVSRYGFGCTCPACEGTAREMEKEKSRQGLFALHKKLGVARLFGMSGDWKGALQVAQRTAALLRSEGLVNRELGFVHHDAAVFSLRDGNLRMARLWAKKKLEVDCYCVGQDHPGT
ncbi:hypothetical protein BDW69DRAFT_198522 [Aspergillus filifer]